LLGVKGAENMIEFTNCLLLSFIHVEIISAKAYSALEYAEATLKNVHDWVVDPFPMVDDLVIMNTSHDVCRRIVLGLIVIPPVLSTNFFFCLGYLS
jgi:hypothetical protein